MVILFADEKLLSLCQEERRAVQRLGKPGFKKLRGRLSDLRAASRLGEVVAGGPHPLKGERRHQFSLDLDGGRRLVFEAADDPIPKTSAGAIDWPQVTRVRIVFIGDYHD
jgi:proteic killer suppression protein